MTTVKYIGPDCPDLPHGTHLAVQTTGEDTLTCHDDEMHEHKIGLQFVRYIDWMCTCPLCWSARDRHPPHPYSETVAATGILADQAEPFRLVAKPAEKAKPEKLKQAKLFS